MGKILRRCLFVFLLILLGFTIVAALLITYGDRVETIYIGNDSFALAPIYNRNGSWLHGQTQIGYNTFLLFIEYIVTFPALIFLVRFMAWMNKLIGLSERWTDCINFMLATCIARMITLLAQAYTLDYIYIARFRATYDLFDIYLGVAIVVILIWLILAEIRYIKLKKLATAGMSFLQKFKWEFYFAFDLCKAAILSSQVGEAFLQKYNFPDNSMENHH